MAHVKDSDLGSPGIEEYLQQLHLVEEVDNQEKSDVDDDSFDMQELTKEQIQEFERESYENWIDARKQERRNKWRE